MNKVKRNVVLIIDDDSRNVFAIELLLKARGIEYISVLSAKSGLDILISNPNIALVFMDMMMPEMDGYEAIKIIKSSAIYPKIPIISVTAQAMTGDREKCLAAGANDYIVKPINLDILIKTVKHWM